MDAASCGQENLPSGAAIPPHEVQTNSGEGNVHPVSLVQQIFNNPEALNLLRRAFNSSSEDGVNGPCNTAKPNMNSAGASKAQTAHDTFAPVIKRPRGVENLSDEVIILEPGTSDSSQNTSHPSGDDAEKTKMNFAIVHVGKLVKNYPHF